MHPAIPQDRLLACYHQANDRHWQTGQIVSTRRSYAKKKLLLDRYSPGKRVLDFGCFDGGFLAFLGCEYDRYGIELCEAASQRAASRGIRMIGTMLETVERRRLHPFDAIIVFDVVEHLEYPVVTLTGLRELLIPGGVLIIETGNSDSSPWRRLKQLYPYCGLVEHLGFFNEASIRAAARRAGLTLVEFQESIHTSISLGDQLIFRLYNVAYWVLRAAIRLRIPLSLRYEAVARGPVPRPTQCKDHFLAVLRRS